MTYRSQWLPVTLFPEFTYFEPADDDNWRPAPPHVAFSKHTPVFVRVENGVLLLPTIPSCIQLIHRPSSNVGYFHHSVISTGVDFAHQRVADLAVAWLANDAPTALLGQKRARCTRRFRKCRRAYSSSVCDSVVIIDPTQNHGSSPAQPIALSSTAQFLFRKR